MRWQRVTCSVSSLDKIRARRFTSASRASVDVNLSVKYQIRVPSPPEASCPPRRARRGAGVGHRPATSSPPASLPPSASTAVSLVCLYVVTADHGGVASCPPAFSACLTQQQREKHQRLSGPWWTWWGRAAREGLRVVTSEQTRSREHCRLATVMGPRANLQATGVSLSCATGRTRWGGSPQGRKQGGGSQSTRGPRGGARKTRSLTSRATEGER